MKQDERGSGTLLTIGMSMLLLLCSWAVVVSISWIGTTRSAQAAADLSALAGASALLEGTDGCQAADVAARRNDARLVDCAAFGSGNHVVVELTVEQRLRPALPVFTSTVHRSSTAGSP